MPREPQRCINYPLGGGFTLSMTARASKYFRTRPEELKLIADSMKNALDEARSVELHTLIYGLPAESSVV